MKTNDNSLIIECPGCENNNRGLMFTHCVSCSKCSTKKNTVNLGCSKCVSICFNVIIKKLKLNEEQKFILFLTLRGAKNEV